MIDSTTCRDQLTRFIAEETDYVGKLAELLEQEHALLVANDIASLDAAMRERQHCVSRILRLEEEWRGLCRGLGYSADAQGLAELLRWCDPSGTLTKAWSACSSAAGRCRQRNDRNGILVSARLSHVQARLGALIKAGRDQMVYGRGGTYFAANVGRVVATEA